MKVGDLVKPGKKHGLRNESFRAIGVILERHEKDNIFNEHVYVQWNDGDIEPEVPSKLELLSESR